MENISYISRGVHFYSNPFSRDYEKIDSSKNTVNSHHHLNVRSSSLDQEKKIQLTTKALQAHSCYKLSPGEKGVCEGVQPLLKANSVAPASSTFLPPYVKPYEGSVFGGKHKGVKSIFEFQLLQDGYRSMEDFLASKPEYPEQAAKSGRPNPAEEARAIVLEPTYLQEQQELENIYQHFVEKIMNTPNAAEKQSYYDQGVQAFKSLFEEWKDLIKTHGENTTHSFFREFDKVRYGEATRWFSQGKWGYTASGQRWENDWQYGEKGGPARLTEAKERVAKSVTEATQKRIALLESQEADILRDFHQWISHPNVISGNSELDRSVNDFLWQQEKTICEGTYTQASLEIAQATWQIGSQLQNMLKGLDKKEMLKIPYIRSTVFEVLRLVDAGKSDEAKAYMQKRLLHPHPDHKKFLQAIDSVIHLLLEWKQKLNQWKKGIEANVDSVLAEFQKKLSSSSSPVDEQRRAYAYVSGKLNGMAEKLGAHLLTDIGKTARGLIGIVKLPPPSTLQLLVNLSANSNLLRPTMSADTPFQAYLARLRNIPNTAKQAVAPSVISG